MTQVRECITNKKMILANDFFELIKTKDDFTEWIYNRIKNFDMELNNDFYIFINVEAVMELSKYESFRDKEALEIIKNIIN